MSLAALSIPPSEVPPSLPPLYDSSHEAARAGTSETRLASPSASAASVILDNLRSPLGRIVMPGLEPVVAMLAETLGQPGADEILDIANQDVISSPRSPAYVQAYGLEDRIRVFVA